MTKYGNKKTTYYGITFDSKKEADRYLVLRSMEEAGEIHDLKTAQTHKKDLTFELQPGFYCKDTKKRFRPIKYIADFSYYRNGHHIIEDAKGCKTPVFRIKEKLFRYRYPGIIFKLT